MQSLSYWLLVAAVLSSAMSKNVLTPRSCVNNEQRPENKAACQGLPFGTLVPYPNDCSRFLVCDCEYPTVMECGAGLWFNDILKTCDWPQNTKCEPPVEVTSTSSSYTPSTPSTVTVPTAPDEPLTSTTNDLPTPPTTLPVVSDAVCQNLPSHFLLPYAGDCAAYIECVEGRAQLRHCPADRLFNPDLRICDYAEDMECFEDSATTTANTPTTTTAPTSTPPTTTTLYPGLALCRGQAYGITYAYQDDCSFYYFCDGDDKVLLLSCPFDNYYNPNSGNCGPDVSPDACRAPLNTSPAPTVTTLTPAERCQSHAAGKTLPLESNCGQYIMCTGSGAVTLNCPNNNYYDPATGNCGPNTAPDACRSVDDTPATTQTTTEINTVPTTMWPTFTQGVCGTYSDGERVAYPGNCSKYISCQYPVPIAYDCGADLEFSVELQECTTSEEANCKGDPTTTTIPTTMPTTEVTAGCDTSPPTNETPKDGTSTTDTPTDGTPTDGTSTNETPKDGTPTDNTPTDGTSTTETPTDGTPTDGTSTNETPKDGTPTDGTPTTETPTDETPIIGTPTNETPTDGTPTTETPTDETPINGTPTNETPTDGTPTTGIPTTETPTTETPTTEISTNETPTNETPPTDTPTTETPPIPSTPPPNQNVCCDQPFLTRLPFPGDARRYIVCDYPVPIVVTCPIDTIFDDQKLECRYSQPAGDAIDSIDYLV